MIAGVAVSPNIWKVIENLKFSRFNLYETQWLLPRFLRRSGRGCVCVCKDIVTISGSFLLIPPTVSAEILNSHHYQR